MGIPALEGDARYYYPDIQVSCEDEEDAYFNRSPRLIIEVLSESTAKTESTEKLMAYRRLASLHEYVLCSQDSPYVEIYRKRLEWQPELYTTGHSFLLESVELEVAVGDIYRFLRG